MFHDKRLLPWVFSSEILIDEAVNSEHRIVSRRKRLYLLWLGITARARHWTHWDSEGVNVVKYTGWLTLDGGVFITTKTVYHHSRGW